MTTKKRLSKKELKQDEFKVAFRRLMDYYQENQKKINYIVTACLAVIVIAGLLRVSITRMNENAADEYQQGVSSFEEARQAAAQASKDTEDGKDPREIFLAAKDSFQMVVNNYSHSKVLPFGILMLANTEFELGNYREAINQYDKFISKYNKLSLVIQAKVGKAFAQEQMGELENALQSFEQALQGPFDDYSRAELYLDLARVNESLGKTAKALEYYEKFKTENPESRRIAMVEEKILSLS